MSKDDRKSSLLSASEVLQQVLKDSQSPLAKPFTLWKLKLQWHEVVGDGVARLATPVAYKKMTLFLKVDHAGAIQNLTFMNRAIIDKVNAFVGKTWIRAVRYTTLNLPAEASDEPSTN